MPSFNEPEVRSWGFTWRLFYFMEFIYPAISKKANVACVYKMIIGDAFYIGSTKNIHVRIRSWKQHIVENLQGIYFENWLKIFAGVVLFTNIVENILHYGTQKRKRIRIGKD